MYFEEGRKVSIGGISSIGGYGCILFFVIEVLCVLDMIIVVWNVEYVC